MIKNIVFDIGQVLAAFRWKDYIEELGYTGEIADRLARATVLSEYWNEVDRGAIPLKELINDCIELDPEIKEQIQTFFAGARRMVLPYDYSKDFVKRVRDLGYHTYILSNFGKENYEMGKDLFTFFKYIDGAVLSYQVKMTKPEPEIYKVLLKKYNLTASECVFLDDSEKNINAAKALGFTGICVRSFEQAKHELEELLEVQI